MLWMIAQIDKELAEEVAGNLGLSVPDKIEEPINQAIGADANVADYQPGPKKIYLDKSTALSQAHTKFDSIATRKIAFLAADGFKMDDFKQMKSALEAENAVCIIVAPHGGTVKCDADMDHPVGASITTTESVLFDAIYIPGGQTSIEALSKTPKFIKFINEALKHCKAIAADNEGENLLDETYVKDFKDDKAVLINSEPNSFIESIAQHRNWDRMKETTDIPV
jgi:catalase